VAELRDHVLSQAQDVRKAVPGKAVLFTEFGSTKQLSDQQQHAGLVKLMFGVVNRGTSVWPWGSYVDTSYVHPYSGQTFSPAAISGPSFSPYFIDVGQDAYFKVPRSVSFTQGTTSAAQEVSVAHQPDNLSNSRLRARYTLTIGSQTFVGVSRAGVFPTSFESASSRYGNSPASVLLSATTGAKDWAEITSTTSGWKLTLHNCAAGNATPVDAVPDYINGFATILGLPSASACHSEISGTATIPKAGVSH
jgi:hypothetical protein